MSKKSSVKNPKKNIDKLEIFLSLNKQKKMKKIDRDFII